MKVTIIGRNDHSRHIAQEYDRANILNEYYSFYYYKDNKFGELIKKVEKNIDYINRGTYIDEKKVKTFPIHILLSKIGNKLSILGDKKNAIVSYICDNLYDLCNSFRIKESNVYHIWSQYSLFTIRSIRRKYKNSKIILEVFAAHPIYREQIYNRNTNKYSILCEKYLINKINKEISLADIILVPSEHVKESIISQVNDVESKIIVLPYASNNKFFYPLDIKKDNNEIDLLYVGQISRKKGINYLLDAIEILNKKNNNIFRLRLIGELVDIELKDIQNNNRITYEGVIPNNKLIEYYNKCDIFVFPSLSESCGLVLGEAMSCKKTVITTKNAKWIIKDGYNGIIINENSKEELINAIEKLMDSELRENISKNALISSSEYTWSEYFSKLKQELSFKFNIDITR